MKLVIIYDQVFRCKNATYTKLKSAYLNLKFSTNETRKDADREYQAVLSQVVQEAKYKGTKAYGPFTYDLDKPHFSY